MAKEFQVKLSGEWKDYAADEDKILKRAYLAGFPNARYTLRKQKYEVNFKDMEQKNLATGKVRQIRPPYKWHQPEKPIVEAGPTMCIKVPKGSPGTTIQVPHPKAKGQYIAVNVPATAKVGQAMLVPVPPVADTPVPPPAPAPTPAAPTPAAPAAPATEKAGWSTGAKVATGGAVVVGVAGVAVAGALLGEHIATEGWDATMAEIAEGATDLGDHIVSGAETAGEAISHGAEEAGEAIATGAEEAGAWISGAAEDVGDFVMDLF